MKPFKVPSLVSKTNAPLREDVSTLEPPAKKRRISIELEDDDPETNTPAAADVLKREKPLRKFQAPVRKPLDVVQNVNGSSPTHSDTTSSYEGYYTVLW